MSRPLHAVELATASPVWLLELDFAGRTHRFASEAIEITKADGTVLSFLAALGDIELDHTVDLFTDSPSMPSVSIEALFSDDVDVPTLVQQGNPLAGGTAQLARHIIGNTYENRQVMLRGRVASPQYGDRDEAVAFSVEALPFEDTAIYPPASATITTTTWPNRAESSEGKYYPTVFGDPGSVVDGTGTTIPINATPAHMVDTTADFVLVAGHRVDAASVRIGNTVDATYDDYPVIHAADGLGREVAYVDVTGGAVTASADGVYWAKWTLGGGLQNARRDGVLSGAGEVLGHFLSLSSLDVDTGRTRAAEGPLNGFRLAGYVGAGFTPAEYVQQLVEILPVSMGQGEGGVFPVVWRYDATAEDVVAALVEGPGFSRASAVEYTDFGIANEIRLNYAFSARRNRHFATMTISGDPDAPADPDIITSSYARVSFSRYGTRALEITTDVVYDRATAAAILKWKARAHAFESRRVSYTAAPSWSWLKLGDVVTLTDPEIGITSPQLALVQGLRFAGSALSVTLLFIEDPPRDSHI
jgi:hypothetical protein